MGSHVRVEEVAFRKNNSSNRHNVRFDKSIVTNH